MKVERIALSIIYLKNILECVDKNKNLQIATLQDPFYSYSGRQLLKMIKQEVQIVTFGVLRTFGITNSDPHAIFCVESIDRTLSKANSEFQFSY